MTTETQPSPEIPAQDNPVVQSPAPSEDATLLTVVGKDSEAISPKVQLSALAAKLPLQLDVRVPVPSFRVQNLLSLEKGNVIETNWVQTEDLPLWSGDVQLVWTEFEVVDQKLGVRVTRLA
jgi:flagellar motor switch protein FliN/FliY